MNAPATDWLPPGYSPVRLLGQGGMGEVWLAVGSGGESRAVKRMKLAMDGAADRLRFKREFIAISKVKHPGIIVAHELYETPGNILYTMDFVAGWPLKEYFSGGHWNDDGAGNEGHRATPDYFRSEAGVGKVFAAAERILEILTGLHRHQIIHRDLKSANLIADNEGGLTLIDFGLARGAQEDFSITGSGQVVGTPLYISPEQIQGQPLDGRCDLYTLGAMLYELAVGAPPFEDKSIAALLIAHLQRPPAPPRLRNPLVTEQQSDFLLRLLAKAPDGRYRTAAAALAALRQKDAGFGAETTATRHFLPAAVGHGVLLVAPFSGNPGAAKMLRDTCEELREGRGGTLLIAGPAGYGKSKLNDEALAAAAHLGLHVWQGGGRAIGGQIGQIFHDLFAQVAAELQGNPKRAARWLEADGAVLAHHFPALRSLPGLENPQLPELEPAGVRARIMAAVYGFFKRQSHRKRIIIAEDLHWADELSLDLLDHLIHNFTGAGAGTGGEGTAGGAGSLLVLANYRPDEAQAPPAFGKWLAAQRGERVRKLTLKPLAPAELEALAQAALGEPRPLGDSARMRLHELTGGNPFFLLELLKNGIEAGGLRRDSAGDWPLSDWLKNSAGSALPDSIDAVLGQRIAALPAALREALPSAAIWGRECAFNDWLALSGLDESALLDLADSAFKAGVLIETGADRFAFPHDLLRAKIIGGISGLKLRRLHGKAAAHLIAHPQRAEREAAHIARHALAAGLNPDAIHWGLKAADGFILSFQYDAAVALLASLDPLLAGAAENAPAADRAEYLRLQCNVLRRSGNLEAAVRAGQEGLALVRTLGAPALTGQALYALLNTYSRRGQYAEILELAAAERAEIAALEDTGLRWNIESRMVSAALSLGQTAEAQSRLAALEAGLDRLPAIEQPHFASVIANMRLIMAFYQGDFTAAAAQARVAMDWSERAGDLPNFAVNQGNLGELLLQLGQLDPARTHLGAALESNLALGTRNVAIDNRNNLGQLETFSGNLEAARHHLTTAKTAAQAAGDKPSEIEACGHLAWLLGSESNFTAARELLAGALALARPMNSPVRIAALQARCARLEIAAGRFSDAAEAAGESIALSAGKFPDSEARARCALAAANLHAGPDASPLSGAGVGEKPLAQFRRALELSLLTKSVPLELEIRVDAARVLLNARQFTSALDLLGDTPQRAERLGFKLFAGEASHILASAQKQVTN